jgi:hypothetical protein
VSHRDFASEESREGNLDGQDEVLRQTNKRLTLNLLIQGAAMHTFLTGHHIVGEELESLRRGLTRTYDKYCVSGALNYFIGDLILLFGLPSRFWKRTSKPSHPFHCHRLLAEHGHELWRASKRHLISRARSKGVLTIPVLHLLQSMYLTAKVLFKERGKRTKLARLAEQATSLIWDIDQDRLDGEKTSTVAFGNLQKPKSFAGELARKIAIGYGGVELRNGRFQVVARACNWPLLAHELTKGTVELICLHGLNTLDDELYHLVTSEADQVEYENWMLQAGSEMWRRFLAAIPEGHDLPETIMRVARLDPDPLEELMLAVVEETPRARAILERMAAE